MREGSIIAEYADWDQYITSMNLPRKTHLKGSSQWMLESCPHSGNRKSVRKMSSGNMPNWMETNGATNAKATPNCGGGCKTGQEIF